MWRGPLARHCCSACGYGPRSVSPSTSHFGSSSTMPIGQGTPAALVCTPQTRRQVAAQRTFRMIGTLVGRAVAIVLRQRLFLQTASRSSCRPSESGGMPDACRDAASQISVGLRGGAGRLNGRMIIASDELGATGGTNGLAHFRADPGQRDHDLLRMRRHRRLRDRWWRCPAAPAVLHAPGHNGEQVRLHVGTGLDQRCRTCSRLDASLSDRSLRSTP